MAKVLDKLGKALDLQSWDWLREEAPGIAEAVEAEVRDGVAPGEIRRFVVGHVGEGRERLAERCESAARHLERTAATAAN